VAPVRAKLSETKATTTTASKKRANAGRLRLVMVSILFVVLSGIAGGVHLDNAKIALI
jgi:hypothetical protein